jgi:predicted nucleic acid-binding protein
MAGSFNYTVILDACVLYPAPLRDLLLNLAEQGIFRARWTTTIHDEWIRNVLKNRPDLDTGKVSRTAQLMNDAIEDCLVLDFDYLIDSLSLPDKDDRHVLAAAIVGHADAIVTFNLKDFPKEIFQKHGIDVLHPDDFLVAQYDLNSIKMLTVIKELREGLQRPQKSAQELINTYLAQGLHQTSKLLEDAIELI